MIILVRKSNRVIFNLMCFQAKRTGNVDLGVRHVTLILNKNLLIILPRDGAPGES